MSTYRIGKTEECDYASLYDLQQAEVLAPGDLVELLPTHVYTAALKWFYPTPGATDPITFRGVFDEHGNRPLFDGRGKQLEAPRAFFELYGSATGTPNDGGWIIENLEFAWARNNDNDMNAAGIRSVNARSVTIRGCKIWNCASGIMSSDESGDTIIEDCDIGFCGYGDGHSHNIYCMGQGWFRLLNSRVHDSTVGQNVKTRARYVEMARNQIFFSRDGEIGIIQSGDGTPEDSWVTAQPGSNAIVVDNEIITRKNRSGGNKTAVVVFGRDMGTTGRNGTLFLHGNKFLCQGETNNHIKLAGSTTSLDAKHNKFIGAKNILYEADPAVAITGDWNWAEPGATVPPQFKNPATYRYTMGESPADAKPGSRRVHVPIGTPVNLRDWKDQGGIGIEWDPVPNATFYRIWREKLVNGTPAENTIWGGSVEPRYVDTFQHYESTASEKKQYVYRVVAVDHNLNQSPQSVGWVKERGVPGYPDPAGAGELSLA